MIGGDGRDRDRAGGARARVAAWRAGLASLAVAVAGAASLAAASPAAAVTFGQVGAWGTAGSAAGQLYDPAMLGVDQNDGSVYTGEETPDEKHFRIQKFTAGGEFKAKVELPSILKEGAEEKTLTLHGIAVDPGLHRIYMIEGCVLAKPAVACRKPPNITFGAKRILVYSTEQSGTALVPASPATLPLPEGEETIYEPQSIAVDPSTHDLVILGEDIEEHLVVQRISSAGVAGARFVDTGNELRPIGKEANSIAVGLDGTTYTMTGSPTSAGSKSTRAWRLPPDLSAAEKIPGFAEAAEGEGWATGLQALKSSPLSGGPQLAVSPDGKTLYWKESLEQSGENEAGEEEPANVLVRGYSLEKRATSVLYGNGEASCQIQTGAAGLATVGEKLVVFDYGPESEGGEPPPYGDKVLTFGSGGSGCRQPVAKFSVNGDSGTTTVSVAKGATVEFDAAGSELLGATPKELVWNFGDGETTVKKGAPAETSITHKFLSAGTYTVTLSMKLTPPENPITEELEPTGDPLPATRAVMATGGTLFKLTVTKTGSGEGAVSSSPAGIVCGVDCEQEYESGKEVTLTATAATGSKFTGWTGGGCSGTGTCKVTVSEAKGVSANFAPKSKFKLEVEKGGTGTGAVTSSPSGIDCRKDCEQEYEEGKVVKLTAHPDAEVELTGWAGCSSAIENECSVTMSAAKTVKATFTSNATPKFKLTVTKTGSTGSGTVTATGINCGGDCEEEYFEGHKVTLTATATLPSSEFKGWTGCESEPAGKCEVTMSVAKSVNAKFTLKPKFKLTVTKSGSGSGTVTATGINCGGDCEEEYFEGQEITLSESPSGGSEFKGWGGACSGTGACKVSMTAVRSVTAQFDSVPSSGGGGGGGSQGPPPTPTPVPTPTPIPTPPPKPLTPLQKALAKCKKLKGKARAKCIKKAHSIGRHRKRNRSRSGG